MERSLKAACIGEFLGTGLLIFFGVGCVAALKVAGAGFGVDTNVVTLITPDGTRELPLMSKADVADAILDEILKRRSQ